MKKARQSDKINFRTRLNTNPYWSFSFQNIVDTYVTNYPFNNLFMQLHVCKCKKCKKSSGGKLTWLMSLNHCNTVNYILHSFREFDKNDNIDIISMSHNDYHLTI